MSRHVEMCIKIKKIQGGELWWQGSAYWNNNSNMVKIERGRQVDGPREEEDRLNRHTPDDTTDDAFRTPIHSPDPCI